MGIARRASANPGAQAIRVSPAADPAFGEVTVNIFDGTRRLIEAGKQILLTIHDGAQNQLLRSDITGPSVTLELPFNNNFADSYSILAWADGYEQAGFQPVTIHPPVPQTLDLMLLARKGTFHFAHARWPDIVAKKPKLAKLIAASATADASTVYEQLLEQHPDRLACLLNIATAMEQIFLPNGTPIDYFKQLDLPALAPDRILGYADATLVDEVRTAATQGEFDIQPPADLLLHGDATSSFKQLQFGEANVQLTFHENNRKTIDGVDCIYVEPDIDYYKDPAAHLLLEVLPNALTHTVTNPRMVYVLRWIAGRHAGIPNFDPLYTIE